MLSNRYYTRQIYENIVGTTTYHTLGQRTYWRMIEQELASKATPANKIESVRNVISTLGGTLTGKSYNNALRQLYELVAEPLPAEVSTTYILSQLALVDLADSPLKTMRLSVDENGDLIYKTENDDVDFNLTDGCLCCTCASDRYDFNIAGDCVIGSYT